VPSVPAIGAKFFALSKAGKNTATSSDTFAQSLREAIAALRARELVVYPTEGVHRDSPVPSQKTGRTNEMP
jgi:hypothetical protein